jgi:nucleoside-diphosphate-sugar epimerase
MSLRILVTGSSGFIGSAVSIALATAGHRVRAASRKPNAIADRGNFEWMRLPNLEDHVDWDSLASGMDVVVHLAAITHRSYADDLAYARANHIATVNLVQACHRQGIKRLVFMSSIGAQTGSASDHVVTEIDKPRPITAYDRAKLAAENEIRLAGVPFTILRPVIVYGPGAKGNVALMVRIAALPLPLPFGALKNRRSLLSIDNLVEAILLCLDDPATLNQTFIVCDREPIAVSEMFATLREAAGRSPRLVSIPPNVVKAMLVASGRHPLWDRIGRELVASSAKLQKVGWSSKVETAAGLRAMVNNFPH